MKRVLCILLYFYFCLISSEINCVSSENKWKTLLKSFERTSTFQLHSLLVHSRTYLTILQLSRPFSIYHTRIWKPREHPHPSPYLTWRAQMPSGEIINVQSKIQVAHQDEANRTKERFAVREEGEERAMADFSFGISEKSQCTKSTWANRMWKVEREREGAGSVKGVETAQRSCQFHLRSLTRICLHRFLHLVACFLFIFCFLPLFFGALCQANFLLNTTWKHFPLREAHIKYHCHVWVCV